MKLKHDKTGEAVTIGEKVVSFRGEPATVTDWEEPRHSGSTGRVYVKWDGSEFSSGYYPSVFQMAWHD